MIEIEDDKTGKLIPGLFLYEIKNGKVQVVFNDFEYSLR
jgi:hypothetical protein